MIPTQPGSLLASRQGMLAALPVTSHASRSQCLGCTGPEIANGGVCQQRKRAGQIWACQAAPEGPSTSQMGTGSYRRQVLLQIAGSAAALSLVGPAQASKLPGVMDDAWEAVGGGPADLYFPEHFFGVWNTESTLRKVETPLGPDFVPDLKVVERARREDLDVPLRYRIRFIRNSAGRVVPDRAYNTARLIEVYMGTGLAGAQDISWNPDDPNVLALDLPGGTNIVTRVTRRMEANPEPSRLDTSEFFQQVFASPSRTSPRVKASQCFTKYRWRPEAADGQPSIVATQVISDYLTAYDGEMMMMKAQNRPVVVYTYKMSFSRGDITNSGAIAM